MAKVNKEVLAQALDDLVADAVIVGWQARPLGMYIIATIGGHDLRPDTKETAMWVQGAMYASAVKSAASLIDLAPDTQYVEAGLSRLQQAGLFQGWRSTEEGDYVMTRADGTEFGKYRRHIEGWVSGALAVLVQGQGS